MSLSNTPTAHAVSPDSGEHWTAEGAWQVAPGLWRIPLPLPMDGLKAVNVYVLETDAGLTLVDGGWAIPVARELLEKCLGQIGAGFADIRRFLVTHVHRDHYTMATVLGHEVGAEVALGPQDFACVIVVGEGIVGRTVGQNHDMVLANDDGAVVAYEDLDTGEFQQIYLKKWRGAIPVDPEGLDA